MLEEHLYMELHPCACGSAEAPPSHVVRSEDGALHSVWSGACARCGAERTFDFLLPSGTPPPAGMFGRDGPSEILSAAEFLRVSDAAALRVRADSARSPQAERDLRRAVSCLREVLKFFPAGAAVIPGVPTSRDRLEARLAAYETLLSRV